MKFIQAFHTVHIVLPIGCSGPAKQTKRYVEKKLCFEMRTVTRSNPERDFFTFMSKRRKYADYLPVLAQNKSILHMTCT